MSSCLDPQAPEIAKIVKGEDKTVNSRLTDVKTGLPFDITTASEIVSYMKNADGTIQQKKLSLSQIVIVNGAGGLLQIILAAADTLLLALSPSCGYSDVELHITIGGKVTIVQLPGSIQVVQSLFP